MFYCMFYFSCDRSLTAAKQQQQQQAILTINHLAVALGLNVPQRTVLKDAESILAATDLGLYL